MLEILKITRYTFPQFVCIPPQTITIDTPPGHQELYRNLSNVISVVRKALYISVQQGRFSCAVCLRTLSSVKQDWTNERQYDIAAIRWYPQSVQYSSNNILYQYDLTAIWEYPLTYAHINLLSYSVHLVRHLEHDIRVVAVAAAACVRACLAFEGLFQQQCEFGTRCSNLLKLPVPVIGYSGADDVWKNTMKAIPQISCVLILSAKDALLSHCPRVVEGEWASITCHVMRHQQDCWYR